MQPRTLGRRLKRLRKIKKDFECAWKYTEGVEELNE